jgi:predicted RNA methylase
LKYKSFNQVIPQDKRKDINEKILYCIQNNLCEKYGLTKEIIYNSYTGDGGLHGLNFNDYDSFHSYTKAKQEQEQGQFFSPFELSKYMMDALQIKEYSTVLDLTCGSGSLFNFVPDTCSVFGNEIDKKAITVCKYLYNNAVLTNKDMREYINTIKFDYIIGNPPFNIQMRYHEEKIFSQMVYIKKSLDLLKTGGLMALIVPKSFLSDEFSNKSDIEFMNENFNFLCQVKLDKNAFDYLGVENFETKIVFFQKKSSLLEDKNYSCDSFVQSSANEIYTKYIEPAYKEIELHKGKIYLENINNYDEDSNFENQVKKILFDIKRNKNINSKYNECFNYLQQYYNQKQPENMKFDEWQKIRITKEKVIKFLKGTLSNQHVKEVDKIELVKTNYTFKLKGYSAKTRKFVELKNQNEWSINDLVLNGYDNLDMPIEKKFLHLINKKQKQFKNQSENFNSMELDFNIAKWLKETYLNDTENEEKIYLNEKQLIDTNKSLQKRYTYLQWEQGSGKTLTGIFQGLYRLNHNSIRNVFVIAPAIAIKNTWKIMLDNFNIPNRVINNLNDVKEIKKGEFILLTFGMLIKNERFIKKFIKINNKKFMLILDEADSISNPNSKRCKSVLSCFRKLSYKLELSGTSTRNSINESFSQFELLYNNSINMLSKNEYIYTTDKKSGELKEECNEYYMKPFPPHRKGYEVFSNSHIPSKITVFGVSKFNQDIYNKDELKELIDKTIITRTLKDITGRELYNINQVVCDFNDYEKNLYKTILDEFYQMSEEYQIKTGNSKKDSMFRILAQLNTLLKACSIPHSFKEYKGSEISSKFLKVFELLESFKNERVAIGCTRIKTVNMYAYEIKKHFPDRPLFVITGNETTLKDRREIVKELKKYDNAILLSTQQALSCSMNIGFIDKVIIPEMQYNDSSMGQYRGRFIRMNSDNKTQVYNVLYNKSIENNLLKLIMCKEKLNLFMKNQDLNDEEIFEKYGVDNWLFNCLMVKETDNEGRVSITWGNQEIN